MTAEQRDRFLPTARGHTLYESADVTIWRAPGAVRKSKRRASPKKIIQECLNVRAKRVSSCKVLALVRSHGFHFGRFNFCNYQHALDSILTICDGHAWVLTAGES
jgi:hypothetical protein